MGTGADPVLSWGATAGARSPAELEAARRPVSETSSHTHLWPKQGLNTRTDLCRMQPTGLPQNACAGVTVSDCSAPLTQTLFTGVGRDQSAGTVPSTEVNSTLGISKVSAFFFDTYSSPGGRVLSLSHFTDQEWKLREGK